MQSWRAVRHNDLVLLYMQALHFMVLDIVEQADGNFQIWGTTQQRSSCLLRIDNFQPYFYIAAPREAAGTVCLYISACLQKLVNSLWTKIISFLTGLGADTVIFALTVDC